MKNIALVYMVAGISSRFQGRNKSFAKVGPKGETLIEYSLKQALPAGVTRIIFIVGRKTEKQFKEFFRSSFQNIPISYVFQNFDDKKRDKPWGTTDALCVLKDKINCPFVICNGDDIYGERVFKKLMSHLKNSDEEATAGYKLIDVLPEIGKTNRGIFKVKDNYVQSIVEMFNLMKYSLPGNVKAEDLCSMNIFALHPSTIELLNKELELFKKQHESDRKAECLLPNTISKLIENRQIRMKIYPVFDKWLGITNPEDEDAVRKILENKFIN